MLKIVNDNLYLFRLPCLEEGVLGTLDERQRRVVLASLGALVTQGLVQDQELYSFRPDGQANAELRRVSVKAGRYAIVHFNKMSRGDPCLGKGTIKVKTGLMLYEEDGQLKLRTIAIKTIFAPWEQSWDQISSVCTELETSPIPGVMNVYGHGSFDGKEGTKHVQFLERVEYPFNGGPFSALQRAEQLLRTVSFLHSSGVVHDDMHQGNIRYRATGEAVLVDCDTMQFGRSSESKGAQHEVQRVGRVLFHLRLGPQYQHLIDDMLSGTLTAVQAYQEFCDIQTRGADVFCAIC